MEPSGLQRTADGEEHGLIRSLVQDASRVRRASSAELHLPWTCPVTHSREKFYTVCSDYALLNQAASVYCPTNAGRDVLSKKQDDASQRLKPKPSPDLAACCSPRDAGSSHVGAGEDCDMEDVSKPILAWEIDTADFNAAYTRKIRTSKKTLEVDFICCIRSVCIISNFGLF